MRETEREALEWVDWYDNLRHTQAIQDACA